jgi:hypothetical protein
VYRVPSYLFMKRKGASRRQTNVSANVTVHAAEDARGPSTAVSRYLGPSHLVQCGL